jgi:sortase B
MAYSAFQIFTIQGRYQAEAALRGELLVYKPTEQPPPDISAPLPLLPAVSGAPASPEAVYHPELSALKALNGDAVGWLTVDGTTIDYPFVKDPDNIFYLHRDIYKNEAYAGTIFMDFRCEADFSAFNTILYGHHMKNGSMFHNLGFFADSVFFDQHRTGRIQLEDRDFELEIFACLTVRPDDQNVYRADGWTQERRDDYSAYIRQTAVCFRETELTPADRVITLSTCAYSFEDARTVVLAKLGGS